MTTRRLIWIMTLLLCAIPVHAWGASGPQEDRAPAKEPATTSKSPLHVKEYWARCEVKGVSQTSREVLVELKHCDFEAAPDGAPTRRVNARIIASQSWGARFDSLTQAMKDRLEKAMFSRRPVGVVVTTEASGNIIKSVVEFLK